MRVRSRLSGAASDRFSRAEQGKEGEPELRTTAGRRLQSVSDDREAASSDVDGRFLHAHWPPVLPEDERLIPEHGVDCDWVAQAWSLAA